MVGTSVANRCSHQLLRIETFHTTQTESTHNQLHLSSTEIKPNYRTNRWKKVADEGLKYLASAAGDPYTVNYLQFKEEEKTEKRGDCRLIRFHNQCSSRLKSPSRFDKS